MTPKPANKPIIAADLDDVLAGLAPSFVNFTNQKWGTHLTVDDYDEHWATLWKTDNERELYQTAEDFFEIYPKFKTISGAQEALEKLKSHYKLVILTSRRQKLDEVTRKWLDINYLRVFSEVHYSGIWDNESAHSSYKIKLTKGELAKQIGADYLIDDQPKHCIAAAEAGIKALLFGDYAWNRGIKLIPNMVRTKNWQEVLEYFDGRG